MIGLLLFIVAKVLIAILYPIGFTYSIITTWVKSGWGAVDAYLFRCAVASDQHGNVYLAKLFNDTLRKQGGYAFGNEDRTISHVLGKNKELGTLTFTGKVIEKILDLIDPGHSEKSIEQ
jgi:8-oxo-dGTP diphosphatase